MSEDLVEVRTSSIDNLGVFAKRAIRQATRILEYTGEVISNEEGDRRYAETNPDRHVTFLFALSNGSCIDGAAGGNDARFINHSCEPNCEAVEEEGSIWIESLRPISAGEELTYDYAYSWDDCDEAGSYPCRCGAVACRGTILSPRADVQE